MSPLMIHRPSASRGHAHHGWLRSYHTFSFASYYSPVQREQSWGPLRVVNEDRVAPLEGFPSHPHREFEIFSYVTDGTIKHSDSMGNVESLKRGSLQMTSAGTGIVHGEYNGGKGREDLHFIQIWSKPHTRGLKPAYFTRHFSDEDKYNQLRQVVAPVDSTPEAGVKLEREAEGPAPVHSDLSMYASILAPNSTVSHTFKRPKGYMHLIMRQTGYRSPKTSLDGKGPRVTVKLGDAVTELEEGDGCYFDSVEGQTIEIQGGGDGDSELLLFDLANEA